MCCQGKKGLAEGPICRKERHVVSLRALYNRMTCFKPLSCAAVERYRGSLHMQQQSAVPLFEPAVTATDESLEPAVQLDCREKLTWNANETETGLQLCSA